jgi:hypothetical protein
MKSRYLLGPTTSPPDLQSGYCGRGYYSPSLRAVGSTLRGVVPSGTESSRKPGVLGQEFLRYAPNKFTQQGIVQVRFGSETLRLRCAWDTPILSVWPVSRIMRARSWSCRCLESPELLLTSNVLYGRRKLFPPLQ